MMKKGILLSTLVIFALTGSACRSYYSSNTPPSSGGSGAPLGDQAPDSATIKKSIKTGSVLMFADIMEAYQTRENVNALELAKRDFNNIVVDFYADWCAPCRALAPTLETLARKNHDLLIIKVNIENYKEVAQKYGIRSLPTLVFIKNGQEVRREIGNKPAKELENLIKSSF